MRKLLRRSFAAALCALLLAPAFADAQNKTAFPTGELTIETSGGAKRFSIELADNDEHRALGLMHRPSMAADHGMLFDFKRDEVVAMWMRNTRIPLDMLFIARDGRVVNIAKRTVPFSEQSIFSDGPVRAVLELNGGTTDRLQIKPGDKVLHPVFNNTR
jgi:uncharacterized membrane protein (UPF0127 family)